MDLNNLLDRKIIVTFIYYIFFTLTGVCNEFGQTDIRLQNNFDDHISSLLNYKYMTEISDIPNIGRMLRDRYFSDGNLDNTTNLVKVSTTFSTYYL